jgi:hypothetical protein
MYREFWWGYVRNSEHSEGRKGNGRIIIIKMDPGEIFSKYRRAEKCIKNINGKPERKKPLERLRHRWYIIKTDLREIGLEHVVRVYLCQGSVLHLLTK